ncbi:MAG: hypothetical protein ACLFR1_01260 [Spirochaetia bacterium]
MEALWTALEVPLFAFYDCPNKLKLAASEKTSNKSALIRKAKKHIQKMKKWAKDVPMNYLHKYYLMKAELAALHKKKDAITW